MTVNEYKISPGCLIAGDEYRHFCFSWYVTNRVRQQSQCIIFVLRNQSIVIQGLNKIMVMKTRAADVFQ